MDHVTAVTGERFRITLEAFGGAGYQWRLREDRPGLRLEARESLPPEAGSAPGSPGRTVFTLVAEQAGTYDAVFVLQRPWEDQPAEVREVTIDATDRPA